jgi:hypothetical protein
LKYFRGTTSAADANYEIRSSRQIELGTLRYDRVHDAATDVFNDSDALRPTIGNNEEDNNNNNEEGMNPFGDGGKMHDE